MVARDTRGPERRRTRRCLRSVALPYPISLQQLEHSLDALHLSSFGLMDTTLEEVFLKVSEDQSLENSEAGKSTQGWRSVQLPTEGPGDTASL